MPEPLTINTWVYTVRGNTPSTILSASVDPDEIRGLIATTYRCHLNEIEVRREP